MYIFKYIVIQRLGGGEEVVRAGGVVWPYSFQIPGYVKSVSVSFLMGNNAGGRGRLGSLCVMESP